MNLKLGFKRGVLPSAVLLALSACGADQSQTLVVSAASSLSEVASVWESEFESVHPEIDVVVNVAGSATLRDQILEGAPVDVFASANEATMEEVAAAGWVMGEPEVFAHNVLEVAVPLGNPENFVSLDDLGRPGLLVGLCARGVPCGDLAMDLLVRTGVEVMPATYEPNVRALLTKVEEGELDAGLVYATDVAASSEVQGIPLASSDAIPAAYPIAALSESANLSDASRFIEFVLSNAGQRILIEKGFGVP